MKVLMMRSLVKEIAKLVHFGHFLLFKKTLNNISIVLSTNKKSCPAIEYI